MPQLPCLLQDSDDHLVLPEMSTEDEPSIKFPFLTSWLILFTCISKGRTAAYMCLCYYYPCVNT